MRLSQLSLANKLGMTHNFLNEIEHGRKWVSPETIQKLCSALEVQPYQFFIPDETNVIEKDKAVADCCNEIPVEHYR
jgi:transcriptional regulator with XRE-family HTH domain